MTQSLINQGLEGNHPNDNLNALPRWICAEDFRARPGNRTGTPRMELARTKCEGEHFLAIFNPETGTFSERYTSKTYSLGSIEIKIVEIE